MFKETDIGDVMMLSCAEVNYRGKDSGQNKSSVAGTYGQAEPASDQKLSQD